jgi:hypothetical protein
MDIILCLMHDLLGNKKGHLSPDAPIVSVSKWKVLGPRLQSNRNLTPDANGTPSMPTKDVLLLRLGMTSAS